MTQQDSTSCNSLVKTRRGRWSWSYSTSNEHSLAWYMIPFCVCVCNTMILTSHNSYKWVKAENTVESAYYQTNPPPKQASQARVFPCVLTVKIPSPYLLRNSPWEADIPSFPISQISKSLITSCDDNIREWVIIVKGWRLTYCKYHQSNSLFDSHLAVLYCGYLIG
jgi:hypothetical protein